ncbi:hypothetical protein Ancab_023604 [Ancistrocladus abbreviatus]
MTSSETALECKFTDLSKELAVEISEMEALKSDHLLKKIEIEALRQKQTELETRISDLLKAKGHLENCFDELKDETVLLNSSLETKVLQRQSSVLEKAKQDLEVQLSELQKENVQLSEWISAMEAHLRYLTCEKESCHLELQHLEYQVDSLHDEI